MLSPLLCGGTTQYTCRVSSTLNRDTKTFGKKYLFDGNNETCWNSDQVNISVVNDSRVVSDTTLQGSPQWISLEFERPVPFSALSLQFQGGFCGKECEVEIEGKMKILDFYPEDVNKLQTFHLRERAEAVRKIRIIFNSSTDFYGRVTLYLLELYS